MTRRKSQDEDWSSLETASETMAGTARPVAGDPAGATGDFADDGTLAGAGTETNPPRKPSRLLDVLIVISAVFMLAGAILVMALRRRNA